MVVARVCQILACLLADSQFSLLRHHVYILCVDAQRALDVRIDLCGLAANYHTMRWRRPLELLLTLTCPISRLTTIGGSVPLQISFLVAFSQLVPAHTVTLFRGIVSLRVPRFPLLYIGVITALSLTPLLSSTPFFLGSFGLLTSWTYLRFYKTAFPDLDSSQPSSLRGDASETFAFAEFFPTPAKPLVAAISAQVFSVLVAMRICVPFSQADMMSAASRGSGGGDGAYLQRGVPGTARAEAERRRAIALKALDQRLHAATANAASRAAPVDGAAGPSAHVPPPAQTSGPTVSNQPRAVAQAAMISHAEDNGGMETTYTPEREISGKSES